jgi:uncharacterized membrane protein YqiK
MGDWFGVGDHRFYFGSWTVVNPGQRGVLITLGSVSDQVLGDGLHMKVPLVQKIKKIDVTTQKLEQQALKAKNDLDRVKLEAEQRIAQAKGEAEAIKIQAEAITQQGGQAYVELQAIAKWDGKLPVQMTPNATLPFINLTK